MRRYFISPVLAQVLLVSCLCLFPIAGLSQRHLRKYKAPPPMAKVVVTVLRASDGKPLQHAAVVFHATQDDKNDGNLEVKTNEEGKASLDLIPIGSKVMVQVISSGYRTFGKEYDVPGDQKFITIRLLPPDQQYSIYAQKQSSTDAHTNTPQTQMGHAEPADSPLLVPPPKKKN